MLPRVYSRTMLPGLFNEFFGNDSLSRFFDDMPVSTTVPSVNVIEGKDEYKIDIAAPGLNKEDYNIEVNENVLTISSEKKHENEEKDEKYLRREFTYSSFRRSFALPEDVSEDKINASHKDGILTISLPKKEEAKPKAPKSIKVS